MSSDGVRAIAAKLAVPVLAGLIPFIFIAGNVYGSNASAVGRLAEKMTEAETDRKEKAARDAAEKELRERQAQADHDAIVRMERDMKYVVEAIPAVLSLREEILRLRLDLAERRTHDAQAPPKKE